MLIVIPGALPALPVAAELAAAARARPALHVWLQAGAARTEPYDLRAHGCTAFEAWQLRAPATGPRPACPWAPAWAPC